MKADKARIVAEKKNKVRPYSWYERIFDNICRWILFRQQKKRALRLIHNSIEEFSGYGKYQVMIPIEYPETVKQAVIEQLQKEGYAVEYVSSNPNSRVYRSEINVSWGETEERGKHICAMNTDYTGKCFECGRQVFTKKVN